ncbi:sodium- and chloride-dependent glycine transporter 2-like isoform X2 [Venturia canescens]|uniref:sodium- and chloride-dependent glycine transporter 2-like isoform X2 n=1 Tax=Venturia canescens TaxID=32260 RepID=UPI001C9C26D0|nr:sodium- and chloride-dependent glycine transporter 2-like isoform X2 [Venturia canescens]
MEVAYPKIRPGLDCWNNEDKYSVANSQAPLQDGEAEHPERGTWTGKFDFLLSLLGYSVGLGNVWRFPYLCYSNGGGAFLIPFTVMLVIAGLPLMFMELSLGGSELPWSTCDFTWSTVDCYEPRAAERCASQNTSYYKLMCVNSSLLEASGVNISTAIRKPPAEEYFNNHVLGISSGIEVTGNIRPAMAACLFLAWVIVFLCLSKGVQSSGKVVYFTALFPYVVLIALFIRGILLPGADEGILYYLTPDWQRLGSAKVWGDAAVQIFFALSPAWGGLITLSSYNKFDNNCYKDSLIVAVSNICTSFFAGLVIFSVIGFLAHELKEDISKVVDQGAGLAFIVYPEVVARLPIAPIWSILFFVMLLTLGLDSQFALMETVTTAILDGIPALRNYKTLVVLATTVFGYSGGIIFTTHAGMYWLQLMDKYAANWSVLLIAITECILVAWVYGADRFLNHVQEMIGPRSKLWCFFWTWMWKIVTPAALFFILVFNWVDNQPLTYGAYEYPTWSYAVGWFIGVLPVVIIIGIALAQLRPRRRKPGYDDEEDDDEEEVATSASEKSKRRNDSVWERARKLLQPTAEWRPASKNSSTPSRTLSHAPSAGQSGGYNSVDTIVLVNGQPMMYEPQRAPGNGKILPGPSILKNSSKADLITSEQV